MVIYQNYTTVEGVERVKAYSDQNMMIERDGALYSEAEERRSRQAGNQGSTAAAV